VAWYDGQPLLALTGYRSTEEVEAVFASSLVDVAYAVGRVDDGVLVAADDARWPVDAADYEWLCSVIREALANYGITGVELSLVPGAGRAPKAEPDTAADDGGE
jgi:hypothetical protein